MPKNTHVVKGELAQRAQEQAEGPDAQGSPKSLRALARVCDNAGGMQWVHNSGTVSLPLPSPPLSCPPLLKPAQLRLSCKQRLPTCALSAPGAARRKGPPAAGKDQLTRTGLLLCFLA